MNFLICKGHNDKIITTNKIIMFRSEHKSSLIATLSVKTLVTDLILLLFEKSPISSFVQIKHWTKLMESVEPNVFPRARPNECSSELPTHRSKNRDHEVFG